MGAPDQELPKTQAPTYDYYPNKEEHTDWWIKTDKFITESIGALTFATNFLK